MTSYEAIARKIVPTTDKLTRSQQRLMIVDALTREVEAAATRQREKQFPELVVIRKELTEYRAGCDRDMAALAKKQRAKEQELAEREQRLRASEAELIKSRSQLQGLVAAFESYMGWLELDGEVDEGPRRFTALREAYLSFKGARNDPGQVLAVR